jgi:hypothetical protein
MRQLVVWAAVAVLPGTLSGGHGSEDTPLQVGVIVHNQSHASDAVVQEAELECAQLFKRAGIELGWMNSAEDIEWHGPPLVLRAAILRKAPKRTVDILGAAWPFAENGVQMFVYYDNVVALSWSASLPASLVLAAALEHEIGHMLLGSAEHAIAGLMRDHWNRQELDYLGRGYLGFLRQEREQMRSHIRAVSRKPVSGSDATAVTSARTGDRSSP